MKTTQMLPRCGVVAIAALACPGLMAKSDEPNATGMTFDDEVVVMSPFEVEADSIIGYAATSSLAGTRLNTKLEDIGSAISVVTSEFLKDTGATDNQTLLAYVTNTEVAGPQGNASGYSGGQTEWEAGRLISPNSNTRVRGLTSADNTCNFFLTDIPWDSYNVERVEVQRGPNSILFGLGSPAGIINATTKTAQHRNFGQVEARYGSYGSNRVSVDINRNILPDELSVRVNTLYNDQKYKQEPAYSRDRRYYGALRYDPKFLSTDTIKTTLKMSYENGNIRSNNPRTITPLDQITGWWDKLNQATYDPALVQYSGYYYDEDQNEYFKTGVGQMNPSYTGGTTNPDYQPAINNVGLYGGVWLRYNQGQSTPYSASQSEYKTVGGLKSDGTVDNTIGGLPYTRRVSIASTDMWATRASAPYYLNGLYKAQTLSDASIFDFYNNLIDGDTKREWQDFGHFSTSIGQTFFNGNLGWEAAFDKQNYKNGQYLFTGTGAITVDINKYNLDGSDNENLGKAYVQGSGSGNSYNIDRHSERLNAYFNHDFNKNTDSWLMKLLGRHTISGLVSRDSLRSDSRSFLRYGTTDEFGALMATGNDALNINSNDRVVTSEYYLSGSLLDRSSYKGIHLSRPKSMNIPESVSYNYFNSTWNATGVDPSADWINPFNGELLTQSENPDNYVGWTTRDVKILSAERGDQDALTTGATLQRRVVESYAAVWQGYLWDGAIVGMYGIRHDKVKSQSYDGTLVHSKVDFDALDANGQKQYAVYGKESTILDANSPSWSVVVKLNRFLGDRLPIDINPFYNHSENFQVSGTRNDVYGNALAAPSGETKDYGVVFSDKEGRFSLRINRYETTVKNASNTVGFPTWFFLGGGNFIQRNEDRADAYEYHLGTLGDMSSAGQENGSWIWEYTPREGQTQEEADAEAAAGVAAWRSYTQEPIVQKILKAWGFNDFNTTQLTTMSTPVSNFTATEDQVSKGWEYELTANPLRNWRISVNVSKTEAIRSNIGGEALSEFVELTNRYEQGAMGTIRQWGGRGISSTGLASWNSNFYSKYALMKQQEGHVATDLCRWRVNLVTNYEFTEGAIKGVNIGAGYRWQDKIVIGYKPIDQDDGSIKFDLDNPYYGSSQDSVDLWIGYHWQLNDKVACRIQLNVRNVGKGNDLIPVSAQYDGSIAQWAIAPSQSWTLSSTFDF